MGGRNFHNKVIKVTNKVVATIFPIMLLILSGCATLPEFEWNMHSDPKALAEKVEKDNAETNAYMRAQMLRIKRESPEMYERLENSVSDDTVVIDLYDSRGNYTGTALAK